MQVDFPPTPLNVESILELGLRNCGCLARAAVVWTLKQGRRGLLKEVEQGGAAPGMTFLKGCHQGPEHCRNLS